MKDCSSDWLLAAQVFLILQDAIWSIPSVYINPSSTPFNPDRLHTSSLSALTTASPPTSGLSISSFSQGMSLFSLTLQKASFLVASQHHFCPRCHCSLLSLLMSRIVQPMSNLFAKVLILTSVPTAGILWHQGQSSCSDCRKRSTASHAQFSESMSQPLTTALPTILPYTLLFGWDKQNGAVEDWASQAAK